MAQSTTPVADRKRQAAEEAKCEGEPVSQHKGMQALADADEPLETTGNEQSAALDWFLDPDPEEVAFAVLPLNVGSPGKERWVEFKIQAVDRDRLKELRDEAKFVKPDGTEEINEMEANLRIAVEGLLDPDLSKPQNRRVRGQQYADPAEALRVRFLHKGGLIDAMATAIANLSGYDSKDRKELKAAKN